LKEERSLVPTFITAIAYKSLTLKKKTTFWCGNTPQGVPERLIPDAHDGNTLWCATHHRVFRKGWYRVLTTETPSPSKVPRSSSSGCYTCNTWSAPPVRPGNSHPTTAFCVTGNYSNEIPCRESIPSTFIRKGRSCILLYTIH
jgi:hypothetical protein